MIRILEGDALERLRELPAASAHCCVTSPPYYGLRDYGTGTWEGGDPGCDHRSPTMRSGRNEDRTKLAGSPATNSAQLLLAHRSVCGKCGARKIDRQIGLEPTPDEYVAKLVAVFAEVRRVLRDDGTLWLNIGDSYAASPPGNKTRGVSARSTLHGVNGSSDKYRETLAAGHATKRDTSKLPGLKPKDLIGIPWLLAFALRADGWYLRQEIIWAKPNPMPESAKDRPTRAHEQVFLLSKSKRYYYDAEAIAEPSNWTGKVPDGWDTAPGAHGTIHRKGRSKGKNNRAGGTSRNRRSVWTIATKPFAEAHFATMPPKLARDCVLAGCPEGGTVLDPFAGAGTTALAADREHRNSILIDLNASYARLAIDRITKDAGLFAEIAAD